MMKPPINLQFNRPAKAPKTQKLMHELLLLTFPTLSAHKTAGDPVGPLSEEPAEEEVEEATCPVICSQSR